MKKQIILFCSLLLIGGCAAQKVTIDGFTEEQMEILRADEEQLNKVKNACETQETVKLMMEAGLYEATYLDTYCQTTIAPSQAESFNTLLEAGFSAVNCQELLGLDFYRNENTARYINYAAENSEMTLEDVVVHVNIGLDVPFFTNTEIFADTQDYAMLINKNHELPEGYVPEELIITPSPCTIGVHFSCSFNDPQYVEKTAGEQFAKLVEAAAAEGIKINAIASYRSYDYQYNLYHYYLNERGQEYADLYYARPGQSEHNSGLAIDVTLNDMNYNEIELSEDYPWLLEHMADYGFILRYPEDKTDLTGFGYESWHLRYVGEEIAKTVMDNHWCLEEYYARKTVTE